MNDVPTFAPKTPMGPVPEYVRRGEEIVWMGRPTMALLVSSVFGILTMFVFLGFGIGGLASELGPAGTAVLALAGFTLFAVILVLQGLRLRRTEYIVTRQSIYTRTGIIGQTVVQTTFDKITDISLKQDVIGRILGFSALNVNTAGAGTAPVRMDGLRNALDIKSLIEAARDQFLRRGEDRPSRPMTWSGVPRFIPDRLLIRLVCPTTRKTFKRPRTDSGKAAPCPHCGKSHLVKEAPRGDARTP